MVRDTPTPRSMMAEANLLRKQADDLLHRLVENREAIERRIEAAGRTDPLKSITGRSALDDAIEITRDLIARADGVLGQPNGAAPANGTARSAETQPQAVAAVR